MVVTVVESLSTQKIRRVVFRVDASIEIGSGHVMRCLTLAKELRRNGYECIFICRDLPGHLGDGITQKGFTLHLLSAPTHLERETLASELPHAHWLGVSWQTDARDTSDILATFNTDWLVVDHYALDARWERQVASTVGKVMVIDDLADREHECSVLLDQNLGRETYHYTSLVPESCCLLVGPMYALLRPEFALQRGLSLERRREQSEIKCLLVNLGGVDKDNITGQVLEALKFCDLPHGCEINVIMGATAPWLDDVNIRACELPWPTKIAVNVSNMAQYMSEADLAIGAAGSTSWERCCMGLPSIVVELAVNQKEILMALNKSSAVISFDMPLDTCLFKNTLKMLNESNGYLKKISDNAAEICDGKGVNRVAGYIYE
ncbi:MAG: UDP-2,4-diacetamido-2,4,6-trideoxy-beta-L-altropyranose hydrolase [Pseudomonadota bacterium]